MEIPFTKMHSNGNDFVIIDDRQHAVLPPLAGGEIQCLANRHRGVGCDQMLVLSQPTHPEAQEKNIKAQVSIFNGDGSPATACGNGMRCVAAFLAKEDPHSHQVMILQGPLGILKAVYVGGGHVPRVALDADLPTVHLLDLKSHPIHTHHMIKNVEVIALVTVGNPHVVVFQNHIERKDAFCKWAPLVAHDLSLERIFQESTASLLLTGGYNVHAVACVNSTEVHQLIWERGVGMTASCGTGAAAVAVAGVAAELTASHLTVHQPGGAIDVSWNGQRLMTEGPAVHVFSGLWERNEK